MKTFDKPDLEIADIFQKYAHLLGPLCRDKQKVINAIQNCRTAVMGGHRQKCNLCDFEKHSYNSCRNRHCPKCQFLARAKWIEKRGEDLLPCQYFHVVFTVPAQLRQLFLMNQKLCYNAIFKAASQTMKELAKDPKYLGANIGCIGVLHTWAQNLIDHPHVHFLVPGGGLSSDSKKWFCAKKDFFLPVRVMSKIFRGKILSIIEEEFHKGKLSFFGGIECLKAPHMFQNLLIDCASKEFIVYAKEPFAGPKQVIRYLGQYTHRIAISNYRLVSLEDEFVIFKVRDKKNPGKKNLMKLHVVEFMRRFLLHVLPKGYVRIRHYGILGSRPKKTKLAAIRVILGVTIKVCSRLDESWKDLLKKITGIDADQCPKCQKGKMVEIFMLPLQFNSA